MNSQSEKIFSLVAPDILRCTSNRRKRTAIKRQIEQLNIQNELINSDKQINIVGPSCSGKSFVCERHAIAHLEFKDFLKSTSGYAEAQESYMKFLNCSGLLEHSFTCLDLYTQIHYITENLINNQSFNPLNLQQVPVNNNFTIVLLQYDEELLDLNHDPFYSKSIYERNIYQLVQNAV